MRGKPGDEIRLQHILSSIIEVEKYLHGITFEQFIENSEKHFATIKQIEIIGEACNALTDDLKNSQQDIPWRAIVGFRNISIHEYFGVNLQLVWEIIKGDLPELKEKIQTLINSVL